MRVPALVTLRPLLVLLLACAVLLARPARAGFGALDFSFGTGGKVLTPKPNGSGEGSAVVVQPDGKIVVAGTDINYSSNTSYDFGLVRYAADGSLDPSFGTGGRVSTDFGFNFQEFGRGIALQPDGKLIVVGGSSDRFAVARYGTDGALDGTFGSGGRVRTDVAPGQDEARTVKVLADGRILVAGNANGFGLARYHADGSLDTAFAGDGTTSIRFSTSGTDFGWAVAVQADGKYVVAGTICAGGVPCAFGLERFNDNGTLDTSFGSAGLAVVNMPGGDDRAYAVAIQPDGKLVVAGHAGSAGFGLARFDTGGVLDGTFGTNGVAMTSFGDGHYDEAFAIVLQADGRIITGGGSYAPGFASATFALTRHDAAGQLDTTFGGGGRLVTSFGTTSRAFGLVPYDADRLLAVGSSDGVAFAVARYHLGENTPPGDTSTVQPVDESTGTAPVTLTLSDVEQGGDTTLTTDTTGPASPAGFQLGMPPMFYEITSSAVFSSAEICIHYAGVSFRSQSQIRLLHFDGTKWVNVTTSVDRDAQIVCGIVDSLSPFTIVQENCDVPGDVEPDVLGDCDVDLADVALARRKTRGVGDLTDRYLLLGDVYPGSIACAGPRAERSWCGEGDADGTLDDVHVIHSLAAGLLAACSACEPAAEDRRLPGDIMPADGTNGIVDDADVGRARDICLGLVEPSVETLLRADVAPAAHADALAVVGGDGSVSVADLVLLVRAARGTEPLAWPALQLAVTTQSTDSFESWSLAVSAWPAWATIASVATPTCPLDDILGESSDGGWSVGCVPDNGGEEAADPDLALITYRAPERVELAPLSVAVQVLDSDLEPLAIDLSLADR